MDYYQYKLISDFSHSIFIPNRLYENSQSQNSNNEMPNNIPEEILYKIRSNIYDCMSSYYNKDKVNLKQIKSHLNNLCRIITNKDNYLIPLPTLDFIIESGIIKMCMEYLMRNPLPIYVDDFILYPSSFLALLSKCSSDYMDCIDKEIFKKIFILNLRNANSDKLIHDLLAIWNVILDFNSDIISIFNDFDLNLIFNIISRTNTNYDTNDDQNRLILRTIDQQSLNGLIEYNKQIFNFLKFVSSRPLDSNSWQICFKSILCRLNCAYLAEYNSKILFNLIFYKSDQDDSNIKQNKFQCLMRTEIIQFVKNYFFEQRNNLFFYYIHFFFDFKINSQLLYIPIEDIVTSYFKLVNNEIDSNLNNSTLTIRDNGLFACIINNLFFFYRDIYHQNQDIDKFTAFLFYQKLSEFDFLTKKVAAQLFINYVIIDPENFFSKVVNYNDFMSFLDDFVSALDIDFDIEVDDPEKLYFIRDIMNCLIEIHSYFTKKIPSELNKLANSDCVQKLQQFSLDYGKSLPQNDGLPVELHFLQIFPLQ